MWYVLFILFIQLLQDKVKPDYFKSETIPDSSMIYFRKKYFNII